MTLDDVIETEKARAECFRRAECFTPLCDALEFLLDTYVETHGEPDPFVRMGLALNKARAVLLLAEKGRGNG